MKANVPEKLYGCYKGNGNLFVDYRPFPNDESIEYIHTDAFIEKAEKWLIEFNNHHYIMRYSDSCEPPLSELTEWFKNYMKGE